MAISAQALAELKQRWLKTQIDVEFPTSESQAGYALYQQRASNFTLQPFDSISFSDTTSRFADSDIFLVDFHRLTIFFAQLQAQVWQTPEQQALTIEFFTQIIYSEPCNLYLGFLAGEPVACAIVTQSDDAILISDMVAHHNDGALAQTFVQDLVAKYRWDTSKVFIEQMPS